VVGGGCAVTVRPRGDDEHQRRWEAPDEREGTSRQQRAYESSTCLRFVYREESFETKKPKLSLSLTCIHTNVRV
jgi:hypothetical protein